MPVFNVTRPAPVDQNSLAAYEGGMGAMPSEFQLDKFDLNIGGSGPVRGSAPVPNLSTAIQVDNTPPKPGFLENTASFFQSDGFNNLLTTGLNVFQATEAKKAAERQASLADSRARMEQMLAMESIKGSQQERELQSQLVALKTEQAKASQALQSAVSSASGTPSWLIPAAIGGAGLLLVLVLMKSNKSKK